MTSIYTFAILALAQVLTKVWANLIKVKTYQLPRLIAQSCLPFFWSSTHPQLSCAPRAVTLVSRCQTRVYAQSVLLSAKFQSNWTSHKGIRRQIPLAIFWIEHLGRMAIDRMSMGAMDCSKISSGDTDALSYMSCIPVCTTLCSQFWLVLGPNSGHSDFSEH